MWVIIKFIFKAIPIKFKSNRLIYLVRKKKTKWIKIILSVYLHYGIKKNGCFDEFILQHYSIKKTSLSINIKNCLIDFFFLSKSKQKKKSNTCYSKTINKIHFQTFF